MLTKRKESELSGLKVGNSLAPAENYTRRVQHVKGVERKKFIPLGSVKTTTRHATPVVRALSHEMCEPNFNEQTYHEETCTPTWPCT
jgi:hypothetical protein